MTEKTAREPEAEEDAEETAEGDSESVESDDDEDEVEEDDYAEGVGDAHYDDVRSAADYVSADPSISFPINKLRPSAPPPRWVLGMGIGGHWLLFVIARTSP